MPTVSDLLEATVASEAGSSPLQVSLDECAHAGLREQLAVLVAISIIAISIIFGAKHANGSSQHVEPE
jgi:hypothetical protein